MICPSCGAVELMPDSRDLPYAYQGKVILIEAVTGDFCPVCGEIVLDMAEAVRTSAAMKEAGGGGLPSFKSVDALPRI